MIKHRLVIDQDEISIKWLKELDGTLINHYLKVLRGRLLPSVLLAQSCLILCNPMDSSPSGSSIHGIFQARTLEWVAVPRILEWVATLSNPGIKPGVSCRQILYHWATKEASTLPLILAKRPRVYCTLSDILRVPLLVFSSADKWVGLHQRSI